MTTLDPGRTAPTAAVGGGTPDTTGIGAGHRAPPFAAVAAGVTTLLAVLLVAFAWPATSIAPRELPAVVAGPARNALYAGLYKATGVAPGWNFHKYLIDRSGKVTAQFASQVEPLSAPIVNAIDQALRAKP